jgi:rSAM/selenodomain-associated transferase 1
MTSPVPLGESADIADCGIAIMAKASHPGRTKTRLVPPLTFEEAAACSGAFLRDVADNIILASAHASIAGYVAFGPPGSEPFFRKHVPHAIDLIEAWHPVLGDCLFSAASQLIGHGHAAAVLLNADSPTLPTSVLLETARALARPGDRVVIGPAADGGYYLLGLKHEHHRLFQDIAWSTERVTQQTMERAGELDLPVHLLPEWYDVDDVDSLKLLWAELFQGCPFASDLQPCAALHTRALIRSLIENAGLRDRLADDALGRAAE